MNHHRIAALTRSLTRTPSRRDVLRGLVGAGLGLGVGRRPDTAGAQKRRKRKPKPEKPNAFGCLNVGDRCTRAGQCCSGICRGKKGKKRCRAHDTGNCPAGTAPYICDETSRICTSSLGSTGICATTTGNAGFCLSDGLCYSCKTDAECQTANGGLYGPRAACVRCASCPDTGGTACGAPTLIGAVSQDGSPAVSTSRRGRDDLGNG